MRYSHFSLLALFLVIVAFAVPTFAAVEATTPLVTIQDGYSVRAPATEVVTAVSNTGLKSTYGVGAKAGATLAVTEWGTGQVHQTVLTLTSTPFALADAGTTGFVATKIYDFPEGYVQILGASANLSCTSAGTFGATGTASFSIGSTATLEATLATTEVNMIASTSTEAFVASAGSMKGGPVAAPLQLNGSTTAVDAFLNVVTATDPGDDSVLTCSGPITLTWIHHGDI